MVLMLPHLLQLYHVKDPLHSLCRIPRLLPMKGIPEFHSSSGHLMPSTEVISEDPRLNQQNTNVECLEFGGERFRKGLWLLSAPYSVLIESPVPSIVNFDMEYAAEDGLALNPAILLTLTIVPLR